MPCALLGALALLGVFPAALRHLFSGKLVSGENAVDNLKNLAQYPVRLREFVGWARHGLKAAIFVGLAAALGLCLCIPRLRRIWRAEKPSLDWLVLIVPALAAFVLVAIISPVDEPRYIYNLMPFFVLAVSFLLDLLERAAGDFPRRGQVSACVLLAIAALALWEVRSAPPDYLYPEHAAYNALLEAHRDDPCVFFSDDHFEPLTEDLNQLLIFDAFYVTDARSLDGMLAYVGDADEAVVYIDTSVFWSSGYDARVILDRIADETDFDAAEELFTTGLTTTYLISR